MERTVNKEGTPPALNAVENGLVVFDTEESPIFPCCPVTGGKTEKVYSLGFGGKKRFDHPVSAQGYRQLQQEELKERFAQIAVFLVPFLYAGLLVIVYSLFSSVILPWWGHGLVLLSLHVAAKVFVSQRIKKSVEIVGLNPSNVFSVKFKGTVVIRYGDRSFVKKLIEANKPDNKKADPGGSA